MSASGSFQEKAYCIAIPEPCLKNTNVSIIDMLWSNSQIKAFIEMLPAIQGFLFLLFF